MLSSTGALSANSVGVTLAVALPRHPLSHTRVSAREEIAAVPQLFSECVAISTIKCDLTPLQASASAERQDAVPESSSVCRSGAPFPSSAPSSNAQGGLQTLCCVPQRTAGDESFTA